MLEKIALFALGFSIGGFTLMTLTEKHYEHICDEEIEKAKEFYEEKFKKEVDDIYYSWEAQQELDEETVEDINKDYDSGFLKDTLEEIIDGVEDDEEQELLNNAIGDDGIIEIDGEEYNITIDTNEPICEVPYVITEEEFSSEKLHYDKMSAVYYADGTLVNEDEEMIEIGDTVGYEVLDELINNDTVYVRNEKLGIDYMITSTNNSYADYILGGEYDDFEDKNTKRGKIKDER